MDKKQAELERKLFESEPDAVKAKLKTCKTFMAVFIPIGIILSFLPEIMVSLLLLVGLWVAFFIYVKLKSSVDWKLTFVPIVCLTIGFLLGQFILKKSITIILG